MSRLSFEIKKTEIAAHVQHLNADKSRAICPFFHIFSYSVRVFYLLSYRMTTNSVHSVLLSIPIADTSGIGASRHTDADINCLPAIIATAFV